MDDDHKVGAFAILAFGLVCGGLLFVSKGCEHEKQETLRACVAAGQEPLACEAMTRSR